MVKTKNKSILKKYCLPSTDKDIRVFINSKKTEMMEQAISSIEYAVDNNLPVVEIFQFKNSDFVILLSDNDYLPNVEHIYNYYLENEMYEFCGRALNLKKRLSGDGSVFKLNQLPEPPTAVGL